MRPCRASEQGGALIYLIELINEELDEELDEEGARLGFPKKPQTHKQGAVKRTIQLSPLALSHES